MSKPIGLAEYKLTEALPEDIKTALPSIEELEEELTKGAQTSYTIKVREENSG